jgi:hypothetical protein
MRNMKSFVLPAVAAFCLVAPSITVLAQTAPAAQTQTKKVKPVKFTISNTTKTPIDLKTGEEQMTIAAGESRSVKAAPGSKIVTTSDSAAGQSGTVITEVTDSMNGSTVNLR